MNKLTTHLPPCAFPIVGPWNGHSWNSQFPRGMIQSLQLTHVQRSISHCSYYKVHSYSLTV